MNSNIMTRFLAPMGMLLAINCTNDGHGNPSAPTIICIRDSSSISIRITNVTEHAIYVPDGYLGTYNYASDTIFLEVIDKPKYNINHYYRYDHIFPWVFYTNELLKNEKPDSVIEEVRQTYFFNQFSTGPFVKIVPNESHFQTVKFYVPQKSSVISVAFYEDDFHEDVKKGKRQDLLEDWIEFDRKHGKHVTSKIVNRAYYNQ